MHKNAQVIEGVQTGVRMEKRLLKVLKALAEFHDMTLGDLLEGVVLHAFEGKCAFQRESLARVRDLKKVYGLELDSSASHKLVEGDKTQGPRKGNESEYSPPAASCGMGPALDFGACGSVGILSIRILR